MGKESELLRAPNPFSEAEPAGFSQASRTLGGQPCFSALNFALLTSPQLTNFQEKLLLPLPSWAPPFGQHPHLLLNLSYGFFPSCSLKASREVSPKRLNKTTYSLHCHPQRIEKLRRLFFSLRSTVFSLSLAFHSSDFFFQREDSVLTLEPGSLDK